MPELNEFYPKKYLSAPDLNGKKVKATIARVQSEEFDDHGRTVKKPVAYFKNSDKGLVLNKTNFVTIVDIAGKKNSDHWAGTRICLFSTMVPFNGKMTELIRVEKPDDPNGTVPPGLSAPPVAPTLATAVAEELDDEIPF